MKSLSLSQLPNGQSAIIEEFTGDKKLLRKLISLGLRVGSEVCLLQQRRQGYVITSQGTRIAVDDSIAKHLAVSPSSTY